MPPWKAHENRVTSVYLLRVLVAGYRIDHPATRWGTFGTGERQEERGEGSAK